MAAGRGGARRRFTGAGLGEMIKAVEEEADAEEAARAARKPPDFEFGQVQPVELPAPGGEASHCVVFLHGLGSNGDDTANALHEHLSPQLTNVRFLCPTGAEVLMKGDVYRGWFRASLSSRSSDEDGAGLSSAQEYVRACMEKAGVPPERTYVVGHNQGGAVALAAAVAAPPCAGAVAISASLPDWAAKRLDPAPECACRVLLLHGAEDVVATKRDVAATQELLESMKCTVASEELPAVAVEQEWQAFDVQQVLLDWVAKRCS